MHGIRIMQSMMKFIFTWDMTPCLSVIGFRRFEQWSSLIFMRPTFCLKTSGSIYRVTGFRILEERKSQPLCWENLEIC
jgi:hypothetical protein